MSKMSYRSQLNDPRWKAKRKIILERDKRCQVCYSDKDLNVHHIDYLKGHMAWEYEDDMLIVLCDKCHQNEHIYRHKIIEYIRLMRASGMSSIDIWELITEPYIKKFG